MRGGTSLSKPTVASQTCRLRFVCRVRAPASHGHAAVRERLPPGALQSRHMMVSCCHNLPGPALGQCCSGREGGCFGVSLGLPACMSASPCCRQAGCVTALSHCGHHGQRQHLDAPTLACHTHPAGVDYITPVPGKLRGFESISMC